MLAVVNKKPPRETERHLRMRALINLMYDFRDELRDGKTDDERRRHTRRGSVFAAVFTDMRRYENFMTISADFLADNPSTERVSEMLYRLSKEVLGKEMAFPQREAFVRIGNATDIVAVLPEYKKAKRATLAQLTDDFEAQMRAMLGDMADIRTPL